MITGMLAFSLFLGVGAGLGLIMIAWKAPERRALTLLDDAIWTLLGSLAAGRAVFVALTWGYFRAHPAEIPAFWSGGMSGPGALAGGIITVLILIRIRNQKSSLMDELLPLAGSLAVFTWLACWYAGEAYGKPALGWFGLPSKDEWGVMSMRLPVQLAGALSTLALIYLIERYRKKLRLPGLQGSLGIFGMGLIIAVLSFLRADPAVAFIGLRLDAWAGLAFSLFGLVEFFYLYLTAAARRRSYYQQSVSAEGTNA